MVEVSRDRFFETLYARSAAGVDIMPRITKAPYPYHSTWANTRTGEVFGKSEDTTEIGDSGMPLTRYFLHDAPV